MDFIGIQQSCYSLPNDANKGVRPEKESVHCLSPINDWKQEIDTLLDEVQIMALMMTLNGTCFSADGRLDEELRKTENRFFPPWFNKEKMRRVFRKLGQDVLLRTSDNRDTIWKDTTSKDTASKDITSIKKKVSTTYFLDRYQDLRMSTASHIIFRTDFPCLNAGLRSVRTW